MTLIAFQSIWSAQVGVNEITRPRRSRLVDCRCVHTATKSHDVYPFTYSYLYAKLINLYPKCALICFLRASQLNICEAFSMKYHSPCHLKKRTAEHLFIFKGDMYETQFRNQFIR